MPGGRPTDKIYPYQVPLIINMHPNVQLGKCSRNKIRFRYYVPYRSLVDVDAVLYKKPEWTGPIIPGVNFKKYPNPDYL